MLDNSDLEDPLARIRALQEEVEAIYRHALDAWKRQRLGLAGEF